jgi:hypothetical protein
MRFAAAAIAIITWMPSAALAQTTLAWKFRPGDAFHVEQHTTQIMTLEAKNKPFYQKSTIDVKTAWKVRELDKDSALIVVTVEQMATKATAGEAKTEVTGKDDNLWHGAEVIVKVDGAGRILSLEGYDAIVKKLAGSNLSRLKVLRALKPKESFQAQLQNVLGPLPQKPVVKGDRWTHETRDVPTVFGGFAIFAEWTYQGENNGLHEARAKVKTTYQNPRYAIENDVFRVLKGEVSADEGTAELLFDAARSRSVRGEQRNKTRGELTLETLGTPQRVRFESETHATFVVR